MTTPGGAGTTLGSALCVSTVPTSQCSAHRLLSWVGAPTVQGSGPSLCPVPMPKALLRPLLCRVVSCLRAHKQPPNGSPARAFYTHAGDPGPIGARRCDLSRRRELRHNGVLRSSQLALCIAPVQHYSATILSPVERSTQTRRAQPCNGGYGPLRDLPEGETLGPLRGGGSTRD